MKKILLCSLIFLLLQKAQSQSSYEEAILAGDKYFKTGDFPKAFDKYKMASEFDAQNTHKELINAKLIKLFATIESLRVTAQNAQKEALTQKENAIKAQKNAEAQKADAVKQKDIADTAKKEAEEQRRIAEYNLKKFQQLKQTSIGSKYQGGIVFYLSDTTGQHGLIAAEKDLDSTYTWQEAADKCKTLRLGGYSDWRLPTREELPVLYANRNMAGGFVTNIAGDFGEFFSGGYWSSTMSPYHDKGKNYYFSIYFKDGSISYTEGIGRDFVRAVRKF